MLSPYLASHWPISLSRSTWRGSMRPSGMGPTFNSRLPSPPTVFTSVCRHSFSDFSSSFGFHAHCVQIVMQVSHGRSVCILPTVCSGVS